MLGVATLLSRVRLSDPQASKRVFSRFLDLFGNAARHYSLRRAALRGAYISAVGHERFVTRLSAKIVELDEEENGDGRLIGDAARIAGLLLAREENGGLRRCLECWEHVEQCADQVKMELGLLELAAAFRSDQQDGVLSHLAAASEHFKASYDLRDTRYEALIFSVAIELLLGFFEGHSLEDFTAAVAVLKESAFAYDAYVVRDEVDPLLISLAAQAAAFTTMACRLSRLAASLSERTWLHAADVIKEQLLVAYTANSVLFGYRDGHGVDLLTRPRIESRLMGNVMFTAAMRTWLDAYGDRVDPELLREITRFVEDAGVPNPTDADAGSSAVSAPIPGMEKQPGYTEFLEIVRFRQRSQIENVSPFMVASIGRIVEAFAHLPDFSKPAFRIPFMDLSATVLEFVAARSDNSFEVNRNVGYLFEKRNGNPVEKDLQQDFQDWCSSRLIDAEMKGVGGGRADLRYQHAGCRLYIEVKQEGKDASFEGLAENYGSQTVQYEVTNARLGVMLVLDKSRKGLPPYHIEEACRPLVLERWGHLRGLLIARVSALRPTPHEASRGSRRKTGVH
ncbi:hypothetical protein [Rhizobium sp. Leaf383]|uniref:hypothetical protein n=1 Tax=Rhizobium sp. Leaf383 TaxID=1736357 RepID=UPI00138EE9B5|nr:hypothetical protein [Rhizobium sp. Leaf383]